MYNHWKCELDQIFSSRFGFTSDDVEDYLWYDAFSDGLSPTEAFKEWMDENHYRIWA